MLGMLSAAAGVVQLVTASSGFDQPIETRIDGLLAGLAAANLATVFLLLPNATILSVRSSQGIAFLTIQLVFTALLALLAVGLVWQPAPNARASLACLLGGASIQLATFHWQTLDLTREFDSGNYKILVAFSVYGLIILGSHFALRSRKRHVGLANTAPNILSRALGIPGVCVLIQLGIVIRLAVDRDAHWAPVLLIIPSFFLIAYRLSATSSLAVRLTERTREVERMAALVDISRTIAESVDLSTVMQGLAFASALAVRCGKARVALLHDASGDVRWFNNEQRLRPNPDGNYARAIAALIGPRTAPFTLGSTDRLDPAILQRWQWFDPHIGLVAPLRDDARLLGFIELWDADETWRFAPEDISVVAAMAQEVSLALRHAGALAAAQRSAEDRALILRVSQAATSVLGLGAVAEEIAVSSLAVDGVESCAIEHWLPDDGEFEVIADHSVEDWPGEVMTGARNRGDSNVIYDYAFANTDPLVVRKGDAVATDPKLLDLMELWDVGSAVTYPLWADGQLIGLLEMFSRAADAFDASAVRLGEQIAAQASLAIRHAHMLTVAKRTADERAVLLRVSQAATSSSNMREMLDQIATISVELPSVESCSVRLWHKDEHVLERVAGVAVPDWNLLQIAEIRMDTRTSPRFTDPTRQRTPTVFDAASQEIGSEPNLLLTALGIGTLLMVPLWIGDVLVGELIFASRERAAFDDDVQRLAEEIGQLTAVAIQRARAQDEVRQHADEQAAMLRVSQSIGRSLDQRQVFSEIIAAGLTLPGFEACQLELWRSETNQLEIAGTSHIPEWWEGSPAGTLISADLWPTTMSVITSIEPVIFGRDSTQLTDYERDVLFVKDKTGTALIVPIASAGQSFGTLTFYSRSVNAFGERHVRHGLNLANQAALAIERARVHERLEEQAVTDGLTGLLNHRALQERLNVEISRANREEKPLAVLMIDVDSFKEINDAFGHVAGDEVLREVSRTLRGCVRSTDYVGRYGGDEFMIILPGADAADALIAAERMIRRAESTTVDAGAATLRIQFSVGFAVYPGDGIDPSGLITAADHSMYSAKHFRAAEPRPISSTPLHRSRPQPHRDGRTDAIGAQALGRRRPL